MKVMNDIYYVGVNDHKIDMFEGQYIVPNGMAYNSYVILDDKIAVMDSVERDFRDEWFNNLKNVLGERNPDYLVVHHMEPDHSANICNFLNKYPEAIVVASEKAFIMMGNFFGTSFENRRIIVKDGDKLSLGNHELEFLSAPMIHWPEVIMSYDKKDKVLFSADAFGKFGALDTDEDWDCEARRYYFGIVGKYGAQVQNILKKLSGVEINTICSLHGPVLKDNIEHYLEQYNIWSSYGVESDGIVIAYTSVYGNTKNAVYLLEKKLAENGKHVVIFDLARCDMAEAVEDAFRYGTLVLATTTYNADIFPFMKEFIDHLIERNFKNRTIAFIENGSWAPVAKKIMMKYLEGLKNITYADNSVSITSAVNDKNIDEISALANELSK